MRSCDSVLFIIILPLFGTLTNSNKIIGKISFYSPGRNFTVRKIKYDLQLNKTRTFRTSGLNIHNIFRQNHNVGPMRIDSAVQNYADNYAQTMANSGNFQHSGGQYGENICELGGSYSADDAAVKCTCLWYQEGTNYNGDYSSSTGHYSQVVWKASESLGIGVATGGGSTYVCGSYNPPGNVLGSFQQNVLPAVQPVASVVKANCGGAGGSSPPTGGGGSSPPTGGGGSSPPTGGGGSSPPTGGSSSPPPEYYYYYDPDN